MTRYAMSIDMDRCIGCQACVVACKVGNERPLGSTYIEIRESVRGQLPNLVGSFVHHRCFHCAEAACVTVCPTGTLSKWNGLTAVNMDKCSGCGYCTDACPYKIPTLADGRVSKCVACLDLVQEGKEPWCVQTCPSQAIKFGERDKLLTEAKSRVAALKARHVNAQVYGETQLGGLGLLMILLDKPAVFGLPTSPETPALLNLWQSADQPFTIGISTLSVVVTGFLSVIARRQHLREKMAMHEAVEPVEVAAMVSGGEPSSGDSHVAESPGTEAQPASSTAGMTVAQPEKPTPGKDGVKAQMQATDMQPKRAEPSRDGRLESRPTQTIGRSEELASDKDGAKVQVPDADTQPKRAEPSERDGGTLRECHPTQAIARSEKTTSGKDDAKAQTPAADMPSKRTEPSEDKGKGDK